MNKINKLLSKVFAFLYLIKKIDFKRFVFPSNDNVEIVVWIKTNPFFDLKNYTSNNDLLADLSIIYNLQKMKKNFRVVVGSKIGSVKNKIVFYSISESCNPYKVANYSASLYYTALLINSQGNRMFPSVDSILLWENKGHMHRQFKKHNISHPETIILNRNDNLNILMDQRYPLLVKEVHSAGSRGLHLVQSYQELHKVVVEVFNKGHNELIIQKLVNMRRDLRIVLHKDEVVSFYWRINPDSYWKPTATSFGGFTEFDELPSHWVNIFFEYLNKLKVQSAAFDIAWENDDIEGMPLILEVSPSYQLNPKLPREYSKIPYREWKKKIFIKKPYYKEYIDLVLKNNYRLIQDFFTNEN